MNQTLLALIAESGIDLDQDNVVTSLENLERFSKLLVKECVEQTWHPGRYRSIAQSELNEHFGFTQ